MKKAIAAAACALAIIAAFTACNANDGKVNDNSRSYTASRVDEINRNDSLTASERRDEIEAVTTDRDVTDRTDRNYRTDLSDNNRTDNNNGVVGDVGDMVGEGINDVTNGVENLGDTVASGVEDITNGNRDNTDNLEY